MAIHHAVPSINCIPVWSNEIAYIITQAVLRQKCRMTKNLITAHAAGNLKLPWSSLSTKGAPSWRASTSRGPIFSLQSEGPYNGNLVHNTLCNHDPECSYVFACPKCMCTRDISNCSLLVRSGWGHILLFTCRLPPRSMTWRCICGVPWHTCTVHSAIIRGVGEVEGMPADPLQIVSL